LITGITLAAVLTALGCSNPTGSSASPGGALGTGNLTLTGTIHEENAPTLLEVGASDYKYSYEPVNKSGTLSASTGGTAAITNGSFEIELAEPTPATSLATADFPHWDNVEFSVPAKYAQVVFSTGDGDIGSNSIQRVKRQLSSRTSGNSDVITRTQEMVDYYYFDADVTITGTAKTVSTGGLLLTSKNLNLNFKKGWNAMCLKVVDVIDYSEMTHTGTVTVTISNPNLYWILQ
jgi:hypothetical protein